MKKRKEDYVGYQLWPVYRALSHVVVDRPELPFRPKSEEAGWTMLADVEGYLHLHRNQEYELRCLAADDSVDVFRVMKGKVQWNERVMLP